MSVNRVPRGLLPLLDAKTLGRTPREIASQVNTTLDLTNFYFADIPFDIAAADAATGGTIQNTTNASLSVPDGQLWAVYAVSARCLITAGTGVIATQPVISTPQGTRNIALIESREITGGPNSVAEAAVSYSTPILFNPATFFATFIGAGSVTSAFCTTSVLIKRLQI